jgi:hypothetical protein
VLPEPAVQRVVEVLRRQRSELVQQRRIGNDRREQIAFALPTCLEQTGRGGVGPRHHGRADRPPRGGQPREGLRRQRQTVGEQAERLLPLG